MANQTVYPFGTGGSLPASIGIINDLTTGGVDKALSAEVGKTIGEYLFDIWNTVDISGVTVSNYGLGASTWTSLGQHFVIPVTPGETYKIKVLTSTTDGGWFGILTSNYSAPSSSSKTVPYATNTTRRWFYTGTEYTVTVPADGAYICCCPKDGSGYTVTWSIDKFVSQAGIDGLYLPTDSVVNNLSDGGASVPLSAEMGKELAEKTVGVIPSGLTTYAYTGAPVNLNESHNVAYEVAATVTSQAFQGGACFGNYLFMFTENNTTCWMYDLSTNTLVQTISIASDQRGFVSTCHCNTVNFGTEYYDANDPFPLIYVSTGYNDGTDSGAIVYRIVATTENDVTTYSLSLVQTLKMPGTGWTEFVVGEDGDCYLCYTTPRTIYRMAMPSLSDGDMTFDLDNALNTYQFTLQPSWFNGSRNQNRFFHKRKMYVISGVPASSEESLLIVLDLATCTRETIIDLQSLGLTSEPEANFIWQDHLCIVFRSNANVYKFYFD